MTNKHPCEWYIQMAEMYKKKYDDLVFKIHEKIESLQKPVVTDCMMHTAQGMIDGEIEILKSLLENEK